MKTVTRAELTWTGSRFEPDVTVEAENGRITRVVVEEGALTHKGLALLPGFVNAHSHAFQRGLRGRGETFPAGSGSFWSWREAMYGLASSLDRTSFRLHSRRAFEEMRRSGITSVGEFHYFHHLDARDYAMDEEIILAAREAGIRLVLLQTYYARGGIGRPLEGAQQRFHTATPDEYWTQFEKLDRALDRERESLGCVVHSVRAAELGDLVELYDEASVRERVFHMHVEEQQREIDECIAGHGRRPMKLLQDSVRLSERFTAVHCTHTLPEDLDAMAAAGATVCVTPLTEGNLGDGIPDLSGSRLPSIALGTDSNARISMLEEMRWLEYGQRWRRESRGMLANAEGNNAAPLLDAATLAGARSLGIEAGAISAGRLADFSLIDLGHPTLEGAGPDVLAAALVFGCSEEVIVATAVGGQWTEHRQKTESR